MFAIQTGYYQGGYHVYDPNTSTLVSDYTATDTPAPVYRNGMNSQKDVYESAQNVTTGNTYSAPVIGSQASANSAAVPTGYGVFFRHDGTESGRSSSEALHIDDTYIEFFNNHNGYRTRTGFSGEQSNDLKNETWSSYVDYFDEEGNVYTYKTENNREADRFCDFLRGVTASLSEEQIAKFEEMRDNPISNRSHLQDDPEKWKLFQENYERERQLNQGQERWDSDPMSRWVYGPEAEAYKGHDIMGAMLDHVEIGQNYADSSQMEVFFQTDEYGYSYEMPAYYMTRPNGTKPLYEVMDANGYSQYMEPVEVNPFGGPESKAYFPDNITVKDSTNLGALTLDERKTFLDGVQNIIDQLDLNLDSRKIEYLGTPESPWVGVAQNYRNEYQIDLPTVMNLSQEIAKDDTLTGLLRKATDTKNGLLSDTTQDQRYEIKVTDQNGNALAKDRIMLESATGKRITMNVDEFAQLGRSEIVAMFATL